MLNIRNLPEDKEELWFEFHLKESSNIKIQEKSLTLRKKFNDGTENRDNFFIAFEEEKPWLLLTKSKTIF